MNKALNVQRLRFDLTTLRLLLATAELGSITRAAEAMAIATTAASRRIADIEEQFELQIFERRPHGMQPTEAGLALLGHARSMLRIVEHMHDDAQSFSGGGRGLVRLAVCTSAAIQFVPRDLQRHRQLYPQIDIEIMEATSRDVLKELMLGHTELAIAEAEALTPQDTGLVCHPYRSDRLALVTPRNHPLAAAASIGIAQILDHALINLVEGSAIDRLLAAQAAVHGRQLRCAVRVRSFETMLAMVRSEFGIGVVPESVAQWLAADPVFHHIPIHEDWALHRFVICHRPAPDVSSTTLTVARFLAGKELAPIAQAGSENQQWRAAK